MDELYAKSVQLFPFLRSERRRFGGCWSAYSLKGDISAYIVGKKDPTA